MLTEPPQRAIQTQVSEQLTLRLFGEAGVVVQPAELGRTIYGKPQLRCRRDCSLNHSISNTGPITVGVLSEGAIGIDVEAENRRIGVSPTLLLRRMFKTERDAAACLEHWSFMQLWTIKEAVLKASGYGLAGGLSNVALDRQRGSAECFGQLYSLTLLRWRQYLITIAAQDVD
ncbi:MAG: 4'-phosphopantetheinyl transferase superfamily protein [Parasynechococcus sp.]